MELSRLVHTLTYGGVTTPIGEPVGFDNIKMTMKRHEFHGMSAEFSEMSLEFYEEAVGTIDAAYLTSLDSVVEYRVTTTGGDLLYSGVLDLSTYSKKTGEYTTVSCKVGEVGAKTTFNNRTEVDVDINSMLTIDGADIPADKRARWYTLYIHSKHLVYTNRWKQSEDMVVMKPQSTYWDFNQDKAQFQLDKSVVNEFGDVTSGDVGTAIYSVSDVDVFRKKYGTQCVLAADGNIKIKFLYTANLKVGWHTGTTPTDGNAHAIILNDDNYTKNAKYENGEWIDYYNPDIKYQSINVIAWYDDELQEETTLIFISFNIWSGNELRGFVNKPIKPLNYGIENTVELEFEFSDITANAESDVYIGVMAEISYNIVGTAFYYFDVIRDSALRFKMYDTIDGITPVLSVSVGDAIAHISQCISESSIDMKSDWYGLPNSPQYAQQIGGGALKFITNGYKIRGVYGGEDGRGLPVSFKTMIESLNAQDCIGWGFSAENGTTYVRVERWNWFYKPDVILSINDASTVTITTDTNRMISELNIGYKKYDTSSDYDSIDSIHGERSFVSSIKAISNEKKVLCDFIADNYAIEETRRAATDVDRSESFKFDENVFILEAFKPTNANYDITRHAIDVIGVERPEELINAMLSPRHMASRWRDYIFSVNGGGDLKFKTGTVNYSASFELGFFDGTYLQDLSLHDRQYENEDITEYRTLFDAETIEFEYPITLEQYNSIRSNPYGKVIVNGYVGWIQEFTYTLATGLASFKLIATH